MPPARVHRSRVWRVIDWTQRLTIPWRGADSYTEGLFTMRRLDDFVPANHDFLLTVGTAEGGRSVHASHAAVAALSHDIDHKGALITRPEYLDKAALSLRSPEAAAHETALTGHAPRRRRHAGTQGPSRDIF
jgi:hypothetical protein